MLVETFITLVNARGIDMKYVAGNASKTDGQAKKRVLSPAERKIRRELKLSLGVEETAKGAGSRVSRKVAYSHAELAYAMAGVPRMPELALYYSLAGWLGGFEELHRGLMLKIIQSMDETWPLIVTYSGKRIGEPHDYVSKLATLVLVEDAHKNDFVIAPHAPAHMFGMDEPLWQRQFAARYLQVRQQYQNWYEVAMGMIRRRMMNMPVTESA